MLYRIGKKSDKRGESSGYGALLTDSGELLIASLSYNELKGYYIEEVRGTDTEWISERLAFFNHPVCGGVDSLWKCRSFSESRQGEVTADTGENFQVSALEFDILSLKERLSSHLSSIYSSDVYMASLPVKVCGFAEESFISMRITRDNGCRVGVVIANRLIAVYMTELSDSRGITGFIGRLEREWRIKYPSVDFPDKYVFIGKWDESYIPDTDTDPFYVLPEEDDSDLIKCAGLSCAPELDIRPSFSEGVERPPELKFRKGLQYISAGLLVFVILLSIVFKGLSYYKAGSVERLESEYRDLVSRSNELREIIERNKGIAERIIENRESLVNNTSWADFLKYLQDNIPENTYIQEMVSKPVKGDKGVFRLFLKGWSKSDNRVAEFVSVLNRSSHISDTDLTGIEKDAAKETYGFEIKCTLK
ncbi:MAG: PilN domain-containing protein [Chitinivibrionales bacterium]